MNVSSKKITALLALFLIVFSFTNTKAAPTDPNFSVDQIQFGNGKTKIAFDSAGRMYVAEKQGRLLLFNPDGSGGFLAPSILLDLTASVDPAQESGLLGLEIDPDHANNRFIYLFYTTDTDQRLVRYTMNPAFDGIQSGSTTILVSGLPREVNFHKAGDIGIHPLDPFAIFITLGDDGQTFPDPLISQDLDSYIGKILRVDTSTGLGLPDNPHYNGTADSVRSRVWASGLRNPFRFSFHPTRSDTLYISENGDSTDRVAMVKAGGNGLWNGNDNGGFLTVDSPLFKVLHTGGPSLIGIEIITSGPFAHNNQPTLYLGEWFPTPFGIHRFTLSDANAPQGDDWDTMTPIPGGGADWWEQSVVAVDLQLGPDGHLYYTSSNGDSAVASFFQLGRYRFANGTPPAASFNTSPSEASGETPFEITFSDTSSQGTNTITNWFWDFGNGETSTAQNPTHTYTAAGAYTVVLTVTGSVGLSDRTQLSVTATTSTAVTLNLDVLDARELPPTPATSAFTVSLFQTDGSTPVTFASGTGSNGNELTTLADGTYTGSLNLPLTDSGFVMRLSAPAPPGFQPVTRGISVVLGQAETVTETFYTSTSTVSGRVTTHRGAPALVDVGLTSEGSPFRFAGARDFLPESQLPLAGIPHRTTTDVLGYFSIPILTADVGTEINLAFAEETARETYATGTLNVTSQADTDLDASYTIAQWRGGPADDLSAQPFTPGVGISTIQDIFSASCTGCHRAGTANNGGLDLTPGNSLAALVDQPSLFVPGLKLVDPGNPSRSYLFEKINSSAPQQGNRMRPSDAMSLANQALIRDWITQLAPSYENFVWTTIGAAPGSAGTGVGEDSDGNGILNGIQYTSPEFGTFATSSGGNEFTGELRFNSDTSGLTLLIQSSDDLQQGSWKTVASRIRSQSTWRTATGVSASETSPGTLGFSDSNPGSGKRFYRFGVSEN